MKKSNEAPSRLGGELISARVAEQLLDALRTGSYAGAEHLPPELDLAAELGVSRTVVRDALAELEREGYIERVRGIGTMVNRDIVALEHRMDQKIEFYRMIQAAGRHPHSDHLTVTRQLADAALAGALHLRTGDAVLFVCKRVLADETPVLFSTDILPLSLFGSARLDGINFTRPIFEILEQVCNVQVTSTLARTRAVTGDPAVRRLLGLSPDRALLELDETCYSRLCKPVVRCRTCYTDFFDFALVRKLV